MTDSYRTVGNLVGGADGEIAFKAEQVAEAITEAVTIGEACGALRAVGLQAYISGNRITVDDEICVQYLGLGLGPVGPTEARWVIYQIACNLANHNRG
ncbi:hypothetical protein [Mycolicibacterium sarraceniae]|nr:hypothetical protein [Mycolicibacterium sarraceniae]